MMYFIVALLLVFLSIDPVNPYHVLLNYNYTDSEGNVEFQYMSNYSTDLRTPRTVSFIYTCEKARMASLTPEIPRPKFRADRIHEDQLPVKDQAVDSDYTDPHINISRGHLVTAKFFCYNNESWKNTFYLTNAAPQYQEFNVKWYLKDEGIILNWANSSEYCIDNLVIQVGVFGDSGKRIGKHENYKVVVPSYYVDAVCEPNTGESICFFGENVPKIPENGSWVYHSTIENCEKTHNFRFFMDDVTKKFEKCQMKKTSVNESFWGLSSFQQFSKGI